MTQTAGQAVLVMWAVCLDMGCFTSDCAVGLQVQVQQAAG